MASVELKAKVSRYFDLYSKIKAQKSSGAWARKESDLTGALSMGTNEYSDLFNVLNKFYEAADKIFGSISDLKSLSDDQKTALNTSVDAIDVDGIKVETAVLRANGVLGALTMTMQVLEAEEELVTTKKELLRSALAADIKTSMLGKIDELRGDLLTYVTDLVKSYDEKADKIDEKVGALSEYVSGEVMTEIGGVPEKIRALIAPEILSALTDPSASDTLNSTLFQAIFKDIDEAKASVAELKSYIDGLGVATGAGVAASATAVIATLSDEEKKLSAKTISELKKSYGRGITKLTDAINAEHDFNKTQFEALRAALDEFRDEFKAADAETQRKLDELMDKLEKASKSGNKKLIIVLLAAIFALGLAFGITDITLDALNNQKANLLQYPAPIVRELEPEFYSDLENREFSIFTSAIPDVRPVSSYIVSYASESPIDPSLGYTLGEDTKTITSSDGDAFDISSVEGKADYIADLSATFSGYLGAGLDFNSVAKEYANAASLDDYKVDYSTWGDASLTGSSTAAIYKVLNLIDNQEKHTDSDLEKHNDDQILTEEQKQELANYQALKDTLTEYGYTGSTPDELKTFLSGLSSKNGTLAEVYGEMAEKGLVSGEATTEADMKSELLSIVKESHTEEDLKQLSNKAIDDLYAELAEKNIVSGDAQTTEEKRAEIGNIVVESHTADDIITPEQKQQIESYNELRKHLEGLYQGEGDVTTMPDMDLLDALFDQAKGNLQLYTDLCNSVHSAYESVFGEGSSKGKTPDQCLQELAQAAKDSSNIATYLAYKKTVQDMFRAYGVDYNEGLSPEENYNFLAGLLGFDKIPSDKDVIPDTPDPNYQQRGDN